MRDKPEHGDRFIFQPVRTDNLRPEAEALVGQIVTVSGSYHIDEADSPWVDEWAVGVKEMSYWIPSSELVAV